MKKNIVVSLEYEGIHCWKDCDLEEVAYLKNPHRHIFHIICKKEITYNDREIEIIMFKQSIINYLKSKYPDHELGNNSCEDLAQELFIEFDLSYCQVLEDGENGSEIFK